MDPQNLGISEEQPLPSQLPATSAALRRPITGLHLLGAYLTGISAGMLLTLSVQSGVNRSYNDGVRAGYQNATTQVQSAVQDVLRSQEAILRAQQLFNSIPEEGPVAELILNFGDAIELIEEGRLHGIGAVSAAIDSLLVRH